MKVYIVTSEAFPFGMASTKRILNYARALRDVGVSCEVLTFSRYQFGSDCVPNSSFEGIPFRYFTSSDTVENKSFLYKLESLMIRLRLLRYLRAHLMKGDVVIGYLKEIQLTERIITITHDREAKYVQELCEYPAISISDEFLANKFRDKVQIRLFPRFDGVIAISRALSNYAKQYISENCLIQLIPILVDFEEYNLEDLSGTTFPPYIFHSGTLSESKDGFLGMLEAYGIAVNKLGVNALFVATGSLKKVSHSNVIIDLLKRLGIEDKVLFTGYLSDGLLKQYLSKASLVIINKSINLQNTYCFSTKLGEYLAAGKPVIITRVGEAMNWLTDGMNAYVVEPGNIDGMAQKIVQAINGVSERMAIGKNARDTCRVSFHYKNYGNVLKNFFLQL